MEAQILFFRIFVLLVCGLLREAFCEENWQETKFVKRPGTRHQSPHSWPNFTCGDRPCSPLFCARACVDRKTCTVFSHNPTTRTCLLGRRPDDVSTNYETADPSWNTYYRGRGYDVIYQWEFLCGSSGNTVMLATESMCPVEKGYVLHTGHYPPLCLRLNETGVLFPAAKSACLADGANLVRMKTLAIYDILKDMLEDAGYSTGFGVYIGADDLEEEGKFFWNDGTALLRGTDLWATSAEGYNAHEDCTSVSATTKIWDTTCFEHPRGFVCQYDL